MCITNAHKLRPLETNTSDGMLHFCERLLVKIAAAHPSPRTPVQPKALPTVNQSFVGHWPKLVTAQRCFAAKCSVERESL